ncbi:MAG: hypothetical protein HOV80_11460 [Polyangiaceae bacterium]|nr:hypothetical protein [Polyangiaceae bacterium]
MKRALVARWGALAVLTTAVMLAAVGFGPPAEAQPSSNNKAAAEALFDEGKKQLEAGNLADACRAFEASQKLDAGVGTLLYLGDCYERTSRVASAWATFREAAAMAKTASDDKREQIARGRAEALEPKLYRLTVAVVDGVPGLEVKRNGEPLGDATWGVALPVDEGKQTIVASAPGYLTYEKTIEVPAGPGKETVAVPKLEPDPNASKPAPTTAPTATAAPTSTPPVVPPKEERGNGLLIGGIVVGGLGVIGAAVTGALVGVASSTYAEGDDFCEGTICTDQRGVDSAEDARSLGDVATGTLIGSLVLIATGATLVIVHFATEPSTPSAAVEVGIIPRGDGATFGVWGRFQ